MATFPSIDVLHGQIDQPIAVSAEHIFAQDVHVLFLVDQLADLGGGERMMLRIASSLSAQGARVTVATFRETLHPLLSRYPLRVHVYPVKSVVSPSGLYQAWKLMRWMKTERVTIAHTFFVSADLLGGLAAHLAGVPVLISSRRDMGILRSRKHHWLYRCIAPLFDGTVCVCRAVRAQSIARDGLKPAKVTVIYNGVSFNDDAGIISRRVDDDKISALLCQHGIPPTAPLVVTVAHILPWKGHRTFIQMAERVAACMPQVHFLIAGHPSDASLMSELQKRVSVSGLDSCVHFLGNVDQSDALMRRSDVACLLSDSEGFPNVLLEAMASRTAVVATSVGGTPEIVRNCDIGTLVAPRNPDAAAEAVVALLNSPVRRRSIEQAAEELVQNEFSFPTMMHNLVAYYDKLLVAKLGL